MHLSSIQKRAIYKQKANFLKQNGSDSKSKLWKTISPDHKIYAPVHIPGTPLTKS